MAKKYNLGNVGGISKTLLYEGSITSTGTITVGLTIMLLETQCCVLVMELLLKFH